jgi:sterol 3beta-glucosyltransferase
LSSDSKAPNLSLVGVSPSLVDRPGDWPPQQQLCGFFEVPRPLDWTLPPELDAFIGAGDPPVFLGFG